MNAETKQKKIGCLSIIILIIVISTIINIIKGDGYDVIEEKNGIILAESDIDFDNFSTTAKEISLIIWRIAKEYKDSRKIEITFTLNGYDNYGSKKKHKLKPYVLDREEIIETNKYKSDIYKHELGSEFASAYLMGNGYYPY
ncbi:MAG: hypothetical protein IPH62_00305 [Ignavibacteriae bacterium]|nr:hypothetical protein [Ignavibacteriota bacterium]